MQPLPVQNLAKGDYEAPANSIPLSAEVMAAAFPFPVHI
jgi:hypothetical protein